MKNFFQNLNPIIRNFLIIIPLVILVFVGYGFYRYTPKADLTNLKCPHEYSDPNERAAAFKTFVDNYYDKKPNASLSELLDARKQFWVDNNCQEELKKYNNYLSGNIDQNEKRMVEEVEEVVDQYLYNSSRYDAKALGFSFQYPNSLFVSVDPDNPERLLVLPQSLKINKDEPMTAIIISTAEDNPTATILDWLESPYSGYDISEGYGHRLVGGQDAITINDDWVIVKTPDGNRRISIALLVEQEKGAKPLYQELQEILDTFSFK